MTLIQTWQKRARREQRNKYKSRTETSTKQEQTQEQHLTITHADRLADLCSVLKESFERHSNANRDDCEVIAPSRRKYVRGKFTNQCFTIFNQAYHLSMDRERLFLRVARTFF